MAVEMGVGSHAVALRPPASTRAVWLSGTLAVAVVVAARLSGVTEAARAQTFAIIFTAIVVEALPFMLLGAFASGLVQVYVSDSVFHRIASLPVGAQLPLAALSGFAFPVCECGSVPVARRLIGRGVHPSAGIAFMLASPVFNPIVLASTWVAYAPRGLALEMVAGRAGLGLAVALAAGWALGKDSGRATFVKQTAEASGDGACHSGCCSPVGETSLRSDRRKALAEHVATDLFSLGKFLIVGAALAASVQTFVPQSVVSSFGGSAVMASLVLMGLAFVSSLCSEGDAFVAVSFVQFPIGSQLAFLVAGPVLDFKLAFLYGAVFQRRFVVLLALVVVPLVLAGALWFEVAAR